MKRAILAAWLFAWAAAMPLSAQEAAAPPEAALPPAPDGPSVPATTIVPDSAAVAAACGGTCADDAIPWQTAWGLVGVRAFAAGPKIAPNGEEYHPHSSLDLDLNYWILRRYGLYLFADMRFWNEKSEYGVTNSKDNSVLGFSKRQFDLVGGPAWNYAGPWEARVDCYTFNNLNRGVSLVTPYGLEDGIGLENRYYLSPEYANLGRTGFDVARADFVSAGYYITKDMVGNDGQAFKPGLFLSTSLTQGLWTWPVYTFEDVTLICDNTLNPKLLTFDVGVAVRPFTTSQLFNGWRNWEGRIGAENTADLQVGNCLDLWYASIRIIF